MSRLISHIGVSVDGFINDEAGLPVLPVEEEFQRYIDELLASIDGMVLGRVAFEQLAAYWPTAGDEVSPVQAQLMHELPKYVLSNSLGDAQRWNNSHLLGADPWPALEALKVQAGRPVAVFAGARAVTSTLSMGLVDQLSLIVRPSLVGGGTRLFDGGYPSSRLRLSETLQFPSGAMVVKYEVVGS
ncbi:MAG: dihydrofolate reductase family protein [Acidimicrobiales bacterium]